MAIPILPKPAERQKLQLKVKPDTARILMGVAGLSGRYPGEIVDDLVEEHLAKLIDVTPWKAIQSAQEEADA